jgi:hypothetical protein
VRLERSGQLTVRADRCGGKAEKEWDHAVRSKCRWHSLKGQVFFDLTNASGEDALDGMKIDEKGNLYGSGPGRL